jgi:heme/copper-type cytochrome/quinol oxidase subunit 4
MSERSPTKQKTAIYRQGIVVAVILAILTIVEYYAAITPPFGSFAILMILALLKAILVVNYFMHIRSVWSEGDH